MRSVRDVRDFSLFFFGLIKFKAKYLKEGGRKNRVNRVIAYWVLSKTTHKMAIIWYITRVEKVINILTIIYIKVYRL